MDANESAYFLKNDTGRYTPTVHVGGAWNPREQHVAPIFGLLAHEMEAEHLSRRPDDVLQLGKVTFDILGTVPLEDLEIDVRVVRTGRTIELLESRAIHSGRPAVIARAWFARSFSTEHLAHTSASKMAAREDMPVVSMPRIWPGGFIASLEVHHVELAKGRAQCWMRSPFPLIAGLNVSHLARFMGLLDAANGVAPLVSMDDVSFPNLDLTVHVFREFSNDWLGFDTSVSFGPTGLGVTHSVLHDINGAFGYVSQLLTVRPA